MTGESDFERLWFDLKGHLAKKPSEHCPAATQDEYFIKTQSKFIQLITGYPVHAVEHKLELEMWNVLYKTRIDTLQSKLSQSFSVMDNGGLLKCSPLELKLRLVLLFDRASGVYFNLIYQLLQPLSESAWPKLMLINAKDQFSVINRNKVKHVCDYIDLDLAAFCANKTFSKRSKYSDGIKQCSTSTTEDNTNTITPRILSRGDRLPTDIIMPATSKLEDDKKMMNDSNVQKTSHKLIEGVEGDNKIDGDDNLQLDSLHHLDNETAVIYLVHHCLIHLGDIARYRQQRNVAAGYYLWAWAVHPDSGHSFNQLAILEATKPLSKRYIDALFYYYIRGISCEHAFPAAMNNLTSILSTCLQSSSSSQLNTTKKTSKESMKFEKLNKKSWPIYDNLQIQVFIEFYAELQLKKDLCTIIQRANNLFEIMQTWNSIEMNRSQLIHILTIHFYLAHEYLSKFKMNLTSSCIKTKTLTTQNLIHQASAILLSLTIHLINWISSTTEVTSETASSSSSGDVAIYNNNNDDNDSDNEINNPVDINNESITGVLSSSPSTTPPSELPITHHHHTDDQQSNIQLYYKEESVIALNLLFLWLRSTIASSANAGMESSFTLTDSIFQWITPAFNKKTIDYLNHLLHEDYAFSINWSRLMKIPEIVILQGFKPLHVPTQHHLCCSSTNYTPVHSFPFDNNFCNKSLQELSTANAEEILSNPRIRQNNVLYDSKTERVLCLLTSVRCIAHYFPSLINWIPHSKDEPHSSTEVSYFHGLFDCNNRNTPNLMDIFEIHQAEDATSDNNDGSINSTKDSFNNKLDVVASPHKHPEDHLNIQESDSKSITASDNDAAVCIETNLGKSDAESNEKNDVEGDVAVPQADHPSESIPCDTTTTTTTTTTATTTTTESSTVPVDQQEPVEITTSEEKTEKPSLPSASSPSSTEMSVSKDTPVAVSQPSSFPSSLFPHIGSSAGLIMNAELAKFIQEQAIQMAAREQKLNLCNSLLINNNGDNNNNNNELINSTHNPYLKTALLATKALINNTNNNTTTATTTTTNLSKLSLSDSFKRELPPRFAKLLQERKEAIEKQKNQTQQQLKSLLTSIDQPAPLARKESEALTDLFSLLSSSDVRPPVHPGLELSPQHLLHPSNPMDPSIHNPSLDYPSSMAQPMLMPPNVIRPAGIPYSSTPDFFYGRPPVITGSAPGLANLPPPPITPMNMEPYFPSDYYSSSIPPTQHHHHPSLMTMHPSAYHHHSNPTDSLMMNWPTTDVYMPSETEFNHQHPQFYHPCVTSQHLSSYPVNSNIYPASNHQVTNTTTTTTSISNMPYQPLEFNDDYTSPIDLPIGTFDNQMSSYSSNPIDAADNINNNNSGDGGSNNQLPSDEQLYHIPPDEDASVHF
ncbi:unnamed protein product [Trichobilharzia szidati]|nr:unnamed protein product [Trichobilharzia szidati]CAH8863605.1 unnamed protein product [Trichobilharzia szidati]